VKIRVALAGLGGVASRIHLPACRAISQIEVVGAADPDAAVRTEVSRKFAIENTFSDVDSLLAETKPQVLIVGTPPATHFDICARALRAGVHVFCEKPFMSDIAQADQIIALAAEKKLGLRVNTQYRYMSFFADAKRRIAAGEFGPAYSIQFWQHMYHPPSKESNWRSKLDRYIIYEFGTHAIDLAGFYFEDLPVAVQAHAPRFPEFPSDVFVHILLRFPHDRIASFSFNRVSHAPEKYLETRIDCRDASLRLSLGGVARFKIEYSRQAGRPVARFGFVKGGQSVVEKNGVPATLLSAPQPEFDRATAAHLREFLSEIGEHSPSLDAAMRARDVLRTVFAAYESAQSGETVWLRR